MDAIPIEEPSAKPSLRPHNYKALKEAHVSGLSGGSIWEINEVALALPAAVFLWSVLQSRLNFFSPYGALGAIVDFLINCASILFVVTVYAEQPLLLNILLVTPGLFLLLTSRDGGAPRKAPAKPAKAAATTTKGKLDAFPIKPFVSMYRGHMMVITCVAILAVDFHVFPRRFAKVENWGTSLMDLGVGSFVFSAGVVSARPILKAQAAGKTSTLALRMKDAIRHSLPLLVLGLIRLWSVKGVDYAEHVTEYGVHWNFFFTLGFLPPFMALCHTAFSLVPSYAALALLISGVYELALNTTDLKMFIFTAVRTNLFNQNREGIFSFFGYLAIFLAGNDTGMYVLPRAPRPSSGDGVVQTLRKSIIGRLAFATLVWTALFILSTSYQGFNLRVSRRLANLPYFLWSAAFNCGQLTLCAIIEAVCFPDVYNAEDIETERKRCRSATSRLLNAINRNGLVVFLIGNLLTGAVNLTMPTLEMKTLESMGVLVAYLGVLSGVALFLDAKDISIKL